jgi:hypothetical protein
VFAEWKELTVAFDYHVDIDRHYYSVPHALVGHSAWARFSAASVEVFFRGERVATHPSVNRLTSFWRQARARLPPRLGVA